MSPLSPEKWRVLGPYLDRALTLSKEECALWLQSLRTESPEIADKVRGLVEEHRAVNDEGYLETGPSLPLDSGAPGENIGAYRLISIIGHGGMGTVWLGERSDGRFERKAAVKFLSLALTGRGLEERFKREGAILGRLSHVNIAELLDAGEEHEYSARERMISRDVDDWLIVATSLLLRCPVWTEDRYFFGSGVSTWTTETVELYLRDE